MPKIKDKAILIGYDPKGKCVYSEILGFLDYYEGLHVWDYGKGIKKLRMKKLKGYLFDSNGILSQEFESNFDLRSGRFKSGYARFADGTVNKLK